MKNLSEIPRIPLAVLPTPLYRLPNVSAALHTNVYIKRDDMTGVSLGGNKVRKLEYLLHDAKAQGADTVLTTGGAQSNHAMLTAACANKLGMHAVLILKKRGVWERRGNQILNDLLGADVRFVDTDDYADIYAQMDDICAALDKQGRKGYRIPVGGSVPLGSLGYVRCVYELAEQAAATHTRFSHIVCATGSGGTHAGLALGAKLYLPDCKVTGIMVDDDPFDRIVPDLMRKTASLLDYREPIADADVRLLGMVGPGYAKPSAEGQAAIRMLAENEGLILDPVYTGKAFAGLLKMAREGAFTPDDNVVFLHSGGAGGLFAIS
ncbi:MAG: D-cysteine desulfhydrase family protein [Eubacteriales bacterium]|nr:D-cysteine desulfhydrase family protein [Eubacteriales bacterium]